MKNDGVAEMKNEECILPPSEWHYSSFFILYSSFFIFHTSLVQSFVAVLDFIDREQNCNDFLCIPFMTMPTMVFSF